VDTTLSTFGCRCCNANCRGGKNGTHQSIYIKSRIKVKGGYEPKYILKKGHWRSVPARVLRMTTSFKGEDLKLLHPFGSAKYGNLVTDKDIKKWSSSDMKPLICSRNKMRG
jgi:hypothetical protein